MNMLMQAQQGQDGGQSGDSTESSLDSADQQDVTAGDDVRTIPSVVSTPVTYTDAKTVLAVQVALYQKGYDLGDTGPNNDGVDGVFGAHTKAAIKKMQKDAGLQQSGKIDEGVIMALGVTPGVLPPGVTPQGRAAVQAQVALDAATQAEHSMTPQDVQAAAAQVSSAAPPAPPELVQTVAKAKAAAATATTPAQVQAAKQLVADAAMQVHAATQPSWFSAPVWQGAPLNRWQGLAALGAGVATTVGLVLVARRR
jgi:peptidoglycan hydrolase-like protein with peptidoglycan-binding domain